MPSDTAQPVFTYIDYLKQNSPQASRSTSDTTVDELVIIGQRPPSWPIDNIPPGSIAFQDGYYGIWKYLPDGTINTDYSYGYANPHYITYDVSAANTPAAVLLALRLSTVVNNITTGMNGVWENNQIPTHYGMIRGGDFKFVWETTEIRIVDNIAGTANAELAMQWGTQANGSVGPIMYATPALANTYGGASFSGDTGLNFALMHELAHITTIPNQEFNTQWNAYIEAGGNPDHAVWNAEPPNSYRQQIERTTNTVAIEMAQFIGLPVFTDPTNGWDPI